MEEVRSVMFSLCLENGRQRGNIVYLYTPILQAEYWLLPASPTWVPQGSVHPHGPVLVSIHLYPVSLSSGDHS